MFDALKRWRRRRVLGRSALPDGLWAEAAEALPFVQELDDSERARLRDLVVLFLDTKSIVGVTTMISAGEVHLPGRPKDIVGLKALAVAVNHSYANLRPAGVKVKKG